MADRQPGRGDGSRSRENVKEMATGRMSVGQGGGGRRQGQGRCLSISLTLSALRNIVP